MEKTMPSNSTAKRKHIIKERLFIWGLLAYPLIQLAIFYFFVNFEAFSLAFKDLKNDMTYKWCGFNNFIKVWQDFTKPDSILLLSLRNSFIVWAVCFIIHTPLNFLLAYYIFKKFFGGRIFRMVVMIPNIISSVLTALIFKEFMESLPVFLQSIGINIPDLMTDENTVFSMQLFYSIWFNFVNAAIVYPNRMNSIDKSILESAELDGCSYLQELWYIIIPMIISTFITYTILGVSTIFTASGSVFLLWGYNAPEQTYNIGYFIFAKTTNGNNKIMWYSYVAALGLMLSVISVPLTFIIKKILEKVDPMNED